VIVPPAPVQFGTVHLFPRCPGVSRRNDGIVLVNDDRTKIPAEAGSLVGAAERKVKEILVAVRSHERKIVPGLV
jgi:hypothetical protein